MANEGSTFTVVVAKVSPRERERRKESEDVGIQRRHPRMKLTVGYCDLNNAEEMLFQSWTEAASAAKESMAVLVPVRDPTEAGM